MIWTLLVRWRPSTRGLARCSTARLLGRFQWDLTWSGTRSTRCLGSSSRQSPARNLSTGPTDRWCPNRVVHSAQTDHVVPPAPGHPGHMNEHQPNANHHANPDPSQRPDLAPRRGADSDSHQGANPGPHQGTDPDPRRGAVPSSPGPAADGSAGRGPAGRGPADRGPAGPAGRGPGRSRSAGQSPQKGAAAERCRVKVGSADGILAVVPHLLGFHPANSLVVLGIGGPHARIRLAFRYDLPDPPQEALSKD